MMPVDAQTQIVLDLIAQAPPLDVSTLDAPSARALFDGMNMPSEVTDVAHVEDRTIPGPAGDVPVRVYKPNGETDLPVLVYFHGGGWVIGSIETHDGTCRDLATQADCCVVSVDYRLAPEAPYPAAHEDCYAVTQWIAENGAELGVDTARIAIGGDSAGGNIAAVVAMLVRDRGGPALRHQLLVYPVTNRDFETESYRENAEGYMLTRDLMRWFWGHYMNDPSEAAPTTDPLAAPLLAEDLSGLPPATVITAEFDPLRDEGEAYARRLIEAGVKTTLTRYDGVIHGFYAMGAIIEKANAAIAQSASALRDAFAA